MGALTKVAAVENGLAAFTGVAAMAFAAVTIVAPAWAGLDAATKVLTFAAAVVGALLTAARLKAAPVLWNHPN